MSYSWSKGYGRGELPQIMKRLQAQRRRVYLSNITKLGFQTGHPPSRSHWVTTVVTSARSPPPHLREAAQL